jgi:hypothetical protein
MGVEAGFGVRTNFVDSHLSIGFLCRARIESSTHTARAQRTVEWIQTQVYRSFLKLCSTQSVLLVVLSLKKGRIHKAFQTRS